MRTSIVAADSTLPRIGDLCRTHAKWQQPYHVRITEIRVNSLGLTIYVMANGQRLDATEFKTEVTI